MLGVPIARPKGFLFDMPYLKMLIFSEERARETREREKTYVHRFTLISQIVFSHSSFTNHPLPLSHHLAPLSFDLSFWIKVLIH